MTLRRPPTPERRAEPPLLERWDALAADAMERFEAQGRLDLVLEALAMAVALETVGDLAAASPGRRDALRKLGARALLQLGTLLAPSADPEDEERAESARLVAPYARDGLRALGGKEPPRMAREGAIREEEPVVLDSELAGLVRGSFDGFRLAEIAFRVRESPTAQQALALLLRLERERDAVPRLRLAADGPSSVRDPGQGRRVAELRVGAHDVELFRFEDGVLAAYAASAVILRLAGARVTSLVSRAGYAEALLEGEARRVELDVGGERASLEL